MLRHGDQQRFSPEGCGHQGLELGGGLSYYFQLLRQFQLCLCTQSLPQSEEKQPGHAPGDVGS